VHRDKFLWQNQLDALISKIYFWNKTLHVSDSSSLHHQEFFTVFDVQVTVHRDKFLWQNQLDALISKIYFWNKTLHVSDSSSLHYQKFCTVHTAMVYVIQVACRIRMEPVPSWSCSQAVSKPVGYIPLLCVQWKTPGDGQRNCPKHVEFYSKNKFDKLVHLVGSIIVTGM